MTAPSLTRTQERGAVNTAFVAASAIVLALSTYECMIIPAQWDLGLSVDLANAANLIVSGTHVNDLAAKPWMPADFADLNAGSHALRVGE